MGFLWRNRYLMAKRWSQKSYRGVFFGATVTLWQKGEAKNLIDKFSLAQTLPDSKKVKPIILIDKFSLAQPLSYGKKVKPKNLIEKFSLVYRNITAKTKVTIF